MTTTREANVINADDGKLNGEREAGQAEDRAPKRRKIEKSDFSTPSADLAYVPGSSPGEGRSNVTLDQMQLITRRNGRGGKLRDMMNMHEDILDEQTHPGSSYEEKYARHIWRTVLASVPNLPECPTDLNEPQYVFLLYSSDCFTIGCTSRGTKVDWFRRVRFCTACYGALSGDEADYPSLSEEQYDYRIETEAALLEWKDSQLASRVDEIAATKTARFESINARLLDKGWSEEDFPMSNKEFKRLVYKDQVLTDRIWRTIEPRLEQLLQTYRDERLKAEMTRRRANCENAIEGFYRQLGQEIMDLPFKNHRLSSFPETRSVLALPSIKTLLKNDTETVTEEQWDKVAPDARRLAVVWWRDSLKRLVDMVKNAGRTKGVDKEAQGEWSLETETEPASSIVALKAKLSLVTSAFRCISSKCERKIWWFPDLIRHGSSLHACHNMEEVSNQLRPLPREGQELVKRLLKDLELDPETVRSSDANISDESHRTYLCIRCDERIAKYMNFTELIEHYLHVQKWYDNVTNAVRYPQDSFYPSQAMQGEFPNIVHDHDWISCEALLVREDDKGTKEGVLKLQSDFRKEGLNDPMCDVEGIGGEDLENNPWREVFWCCLLCPESFAPYPCPIREIELHIRTKHDKEPDLETDTTLDIFYSTNPCPL